MYGGMFNRPPQMPASSWLSYIRVPEVRPASDEVQRLGGTVMNGPMEVPGGDWIAQCMDPQGAALAVHAKAG
jgi:predicted enzyme related to lactoylglutathione lyase